MLAEPYHDSPPPLPSILINPPRPASAFLPRQKPFAACTGLDWTGLDYTTNPLLSELKWSRPPFPFTLMRAVPHPLRGVSLHAVIEVCQVVVPWDIVEAVTLHAEVAATHGDSADAVLDAVRPKVRVQHLLDLQSSAMIQYELSDTTRPCISGNHLMSLNLQKDKIHSVFTTVLIVGSTAVHSLCSGPTPKRPCRHYRCSHICQSHFC